MHYHYFTLEQREALRDAIQARFEGEPRRKALERLHEPDFGTCLRCGKDIAFVLLRDDPATIICRDCGP